MVSSSYIKLTIELMRSFGVAINWDNDLIVVKPGKYRTSDSSLFNESDWSAASYFYSAIALETGIA